MLSGDKADVQPGGPFVINAALGYASGELSVRRMGPGPTSPAAPIASRGPQSVATPPTSPLGTTDHVPLPCPGGLHPLARPRSRRAVTPAPPTSPVTSRFTPPITGTEKQTLKMRTLGLAHMEGGARPEARAAAPRSCGPIARSLLF